MAPDEKSLKYSTSLSPLAYVTSRKRFSSLSAYIASTVVAIIELIAVGTSLPRVSDCANGMSAVRDLAKMSAADWRFRGSVFVFTSSRPGRRVGGASRSWGGGGGRARAVLVPP